MNISDTKQDNIFDIELRVFLEAVFLRYNHDFRQYAISSVRRRMNAALSQFGLGSISRMQEKTLRDPEFFGKLLQFLTVGTSEMFRDPSFFSALRTQVVPMLKTYPSVKIWIAGCSTGEEVHSLAILLEEEGLLPRSLIYATDINPQALTKAQSGIYDVEQVRKFTASYQQSGGKASLSDYYNASYGAAAFDPRLRKNVVFADHSLATDHVFSEVHLILCRNVLIYFDRELQNRAFGIFRESLIHNGFLALGSKESVRFSDHENAFQPFCMSERIYQKK